MYCLNMLRIALELARDNHTYEDVASKFSSILSILLMRTTSVGTFLWDAEDGFFYDVLSSRTARHPLKVRSMVGLIPLLP